jgi:hypothetical protein
VASAACFALRLHASAAPPRVGLTQALDLMFNLFSELEINLGRARLALALAFLGTVALSFALKGLGADPIWSMPYAVVSFSFSAWFMSRAAQKQGRSPLLYGLATLFPPTAMLAFSALYNRDLETRA